MAYSAWLRVVFVCAQNCFLPFRKCWFCKGFLKIIITYFLDFLFTVCGLLFLSASSNNLFFYCSRINKQRSAVSYSSGRETNHRRHSNGVTSECIPLIGDNDHTSTHLVPWVNRLGDSVASNKRHLISISCDSDDTLEGSDEKEESYVSLRREKPGARRSGQSDRARPSLLRVLVRQFGGSIAVFLVQRLVSDSTLIISPLLLGWVSELKYSMGAY